MLSISKPEYLRDDTQKPNLISQSILPQWSGGQSSWLQNGDVLCFLWGTNWIYICYVEESRPDRLGGLVVRAPGCRTEMYCVSCEVRIEFIYVMQKNEDRLCGLVVRVPGHRTEMYCVSCEVRNAFMYVIHKRVDCFCGLVVRVPGCRSGGPGSILGSTRFSEK
jgi:hypothetical protein